MPNSAARPLVLASSSRFRRELLERLGLPFECISPNVDEAPRSGEDAIALARSLAEAKAAAVARDFPEAIVVGSDQVGACGERILGKPGTPSANVEQLVETAGKVVHFHTGLCVAADGEQDVDVVTYSVTFRSFGRDEAAAYVSREAAHDCAGGFRSEALGIALFERMEGSDPTALIGLPLIRLCQALRRFGLDPLG